MAVPLEDGCCGLGCNNCILDRFLDCARRPNLTNKFNLFNQKSYQKFRVKNIVEERHLIYQFTFELVCDRGEPFQSDEQLIAQPVSYLQLRAPRDFEGNPINPIFKSALEFLEPDEEPDDNERFFRSQAQRFDKGTPEIYFSRKYTPFEVNEETRAFKIIVKLERAGKMSRYFSRLHIGSVCEFKGPFEAFSYTHEEIENYIVFTQGEFIGSC